MKKKSLLTMATSLLVAVSLLAGCATSQTAPASGTKTEGESTGIDYPTKPIEISVPFAAGGGTDLSARAVAEYLSKEWGQSITVVNKPGASGALGTDAVLKQGKNDGYSVLIHNVSSTSALMGGKSDLTFTVDDFEYVGQVVEDPLAFVVKADAPWNDLNEFAEWVKANPDQLTFTSSGPTAIATFGLVEFLDNVGGDYSKARMITTKGAADAMPKVAGGHAVLGIQGVSEVSTMVKSGKVKIIGIVSDERSPYFPDILTVEEQGLPAMKAKWWSGVSFPKGTQPEIIQKWEAALEKASNDPAFQEKLTAINAEGAFLNAADFGKLVKEETDNYTKIATEKGLRK
ncbi:tripartite-type tricarboxylate transporter receptor subunit TctC [Bacillus mesophilus]|uniref:Tripartite tricarboxylate transporter substrate binding protein n=1 Tax=Bacillus mesophilus TaxID=1808955 RepID=A0A6M0Q3F0_9BACI|nr:tripartite tricarboxylate transporter substrate binding protein [Bacillus mesophilus]MBM7660036.1 tripartite-type tricarboxylate transporter receptor subunit TctC [Bacillus mesophilus]NEY70896.1 tripartite tricarboxylate transporter substrate binding protein [Bacillus mesophilus]